MGQWKVSTSPSTMTRKFLMCFLDWGLVTYRVSDLLFDKKTSSEKYKNRVAYVVAHELAHQWFGNLVTMDWWSELWLNEGFATWVGWLAVDHLHPGKFSSLYIRR